MRKIHGENRQSECGGDRNGAFMQLHDAFTDGEPETVADRRVGRVGLVELVEDAVDVFRRDLFPGVPDFDRQDIVFRADFDDDFSAHRAELEIQTSDSRSSLPET